MSLDTALQRLEILQFLVDGQRLTARATTAAATTDATAITSPSAGFADALAGQERAAAPTPAGPYAKEIAAAASRHGVDAELVRAVIRQESGFDAKATSHAGAQGLMQLMPATARSLGVVNPYDPVQSIEGGTRYLREMLDRFDGDVSLALAAYNAGPNAVARYGGIPPYRETQNYVERVLDLYRTNDEERSDP